MRKQWHMFQTKDQDKVLEKIPNRRETNTDKDFEAIVIGILTELGKIIDGHSEEFSKVLENINKNQSEAEYNNRKENILEGIKSRLGDTKECVSIWRMPAC